MSVHGLGGTVVSVLPAGTPDTPPDAVVTPGTIGFVVTFLVAVAVLLLLRDMSRRVRRLDVRAEERDAAQLRDDDGSDGPGASPPSGGSGTDS